MIYAGSGHIDVKHPIIDVDYSPNNRQIEYSALFQSNLNL